MPPTVEALIAWLALAAVAGFLCGLRPFAVAFCLGLAGADGWFELPAGLAFLAEMPVLVTLAGLTLAERVADSRALHGQDEDWLLTSLRVPIGAMLTAGGLLEVFGPWGWLGLPIGAALAASGQALKAALRALCGLLGGGRTGSTLAVLLDLAVPGLLALAWMWPTAGLAWLGLTLLVALPAAIWWARELRSRWRHWSASPVDPAA